eukprot:10930759-Ditylum_brightwellii.AAC.1
MASASLFSFTFFFDDCVTGGGGLDIVLVAALKGWLNDFSVDERENQWVDPRMENHRWEEEREMGRSFIELDNKIDLIGVTTGGFSSGSTCGFDAATAGAGGDTAFMVDFTFDLLEAV